MNLICMCHYSIALKDGEIEHHVAPIPRLLFGDQLTLAHVLCCIVHIFLNQINWEGSFQLCLTGMPGCALGR